MSVAKSQKAILRPSTKVNYRRPRKQTDTLKFERKDVDSHKSLLGRRQGEHSHGAQQPLQGTLKRDKKVFEVGRESQCDRNV